MGNLEKLPFLTSEHARIHALNDGQLLQTILCDGFKNAVKLNTLSFPSKAYGESRILHTGGNAHIKRGSLESKDGTQLSVSLIRDIDNAGVIVQNCDGEEITKVVFRDRRADGTLGATPPAILTHVGKKAPSDVPTRSRQVGATSWYYSSPEDVQIVGRKSIEFSITSSNPEQSIAHLLEQKQSKLSVDAKQLASFIDDPFAYIPFDQPTPDNINKWWTLWWHVIQRGVRQKKIPFPGQTSQSGFKGFFDHVVTKSKELLKPLGYTHLSGVPTWYYVWNLNMKKGFQPDNPEQHEEALQFFSKLDGVVVPSHPPKKLEELEHKSALASWIAVAPFMMQLSPEFVPELNIDHTFVNGDFKAIYASMMEQFYNKEQRAFYTYPLAPGRNLWHSLDLSI